MGPMASRGGGAEAGGDTPRDAAWGSMAEHAAALDGLLPFLSRFGAEIDRFAGTNFVAAIGTILSATSYSIY